MEIVQEMGKSYIVVEDNTTGEYEYMREMLTNNAIPGLLECSRVLHNNRTVLKYDITNKKSISKEYEGQQLTYEEIRRLILTLGEILKCGMDYLLEESMYNIDPDYIFKDVETGEIAVLYLPFQVLADPMYEIAGRYYKFNDFLLEKTDHRSEKAVGLAYKFYRMSKEEFFSIESFCYSLSREVNDARGEKSEYAIADKCSMEDYRTNQQYPTENSEHASLNSEYSAESTRYNETDYNHSHNFSNTSGTVNEEEKQVSFLGGAIVAVMSAICVAVYILFLQNNIYGTYVGLAGIILGISGLIMTGYNIYKYIEFKRIDDIGAAENNVTVNEYWYDGNETQMLEGEDTLTINDDKDMEKSNKIFRWNEEGVTREKILRDYPVVIGKKYDSVDLCLSEPTVSRRHARFTRKGNEIYVQDLGSKNGTYVAGRKISAGELVKVDNTTQIRFGKVVASVV